MTVREIYDYIDSLAPFSTQDGFDNSGLLIGDGIDTVKKAAVCLDITNEVIEEAKAAGAELIISHHPVIFHKPSYVNKNSPIYRLVRNGIAAICIHTPLDMASNGISDRMFRMMGFPEPEKAEILDIIDDKAGIGYGKIAVLEKETTADELALLAKKVFNCTSIKYTDGGKPIKTVAVSSGAGNDEIYNCIAKGVDALISGDIKWHGFVDAKNAGVTVIDAGHYQTEVIACEPLRAMLSEKFPEIEFFIPSANADCCKYI